MAKRSGGTFLLRYHEVLEIPVQMVAVGAVMVSLIFWGWPVVFPDPQSEADLTRVRGRIVEWDEYTSRGSTDFYLTLEGLEDHITVRNPLLDWVGQTTHGFRERLRALQPGAIASARVADDHYAYELSIDGQVIYGWEQGQAWLSHHRWVHDQIRHYGPPVAVIAILAWWQLAAWKRRMEARQGGGGTA